MCFFEIVIKNVLFFTSFKVFFCLDFPRGGCYDKDEYKMITGQDITKFNEFVAKCQQLNKKLWLRQVVVPGINDDEQHILKLKQFASKLSNVERIELLPYHSMGKAKYDDLGLKYRLNDTPDMDKDRCKQLEQLLK